VLAGFRTIVFDDGQEHLVMLIALDLLRTRLREDVLAALERSAARRRLPVHRRGTDALGETSSPC
jgi:hypothetical protein